jgi:hypothetical protein
VHKLQPFASSREGCRATAGYLDLTNTGLPSLSFPPTYILPEVNSSENSSALIDAADARCSRFNTDVEAACFHKPAEQTSALEMLDGGAKSNPE